ncbi:hypothetical protein I79_020960 [Cricetulus griseus]|uniref:Uncharacterized protein n=1 Tax=Cricetulus griseus TaxID=10029 RepID=G3IBE0_CRIGR|nr:hypothetical protein I79_020960 [Cricetulus griseus]
MRGEEIGLCFATRKRAPGQAGEDRLCLRMGRPPTSHLGHRISLRCACDMGKCCQGFEESMIFGMLDSDGWSPWNTNDQCVTEVTVVR